MRATPTHKVSDRQTGEVLFTGTKPACADFMAFHETKSQLNDLLQKKSRKR